MPFLGERRAREIVTGRLARAGIAVGGSRPWDLQVHDGRFFSRVLRGGSLAAGESYMDGWWDAERLDEFFDRIFRADLHRLFKGGLREGLSALYAFLFNRQTLSRARRVADAHYNLGLDVFKAMLDRRLSYTCAYWSGARSLDEAQEAKLELICGKLALKPGLSVLEYGCGWGTFAKYAAERYGVEVLGVNVAEEQVRAGRELCRGLPVELRVQDYRTVQGRFDRVVSIGLLEHVGPKNYRAYVESAARNLKEDGVAFIHAIFENESLWRCDPWFDKYIFPNALTPSLAQVSAALEGLFVVEDCQNIGPHYDPTLMAWNGNLERAWPGLRDKYGERFRRMMRFYLLSSAASFRSRRSQVYQLVLTREGRAQPGRGEGAVPAAGTLLGAAA